METEADRRAGEFPSSANAIDLSGYLPAFLNRISNRWSYTSSEFYRKRFKIGMSEWRLMVLLASEPWSQATRVDEVIGMDKSAVSRTLRSLERRGLATTRRNHVDSRRHEMALTREGLRLHDEIARVARARADHLLDGFSDEERDRLFSFMARLERNLDGLQKIPLQTF